MLAVMMVFSALAEARAESFKSWAARGAREEREKDPKAAFSSYSNALSMWDEDDGAGAKAKVLCARAGLREKEGDGAGALADLSDCLALDKKNAKAFHRRGNLLLKDGKAAAAIGDFYKAVALDIRFAQAYADRARAYESQGESAFAREDYRQACDLGVKAACAKSGKAAGTHTVVVVVSKGGESYSRTVRVEEGSNAESAGKVNGMDMTVKASLSTQKKRQLIEFLIEVSQPDRNRWIQLMTGAKVRRGDRVRLLECGEWTVDMTYDASPGVPAWRPQDGNHRFTAVLGDRTCRLVQDAGSQASILDTTRRDGEPPKGFHLNASLSIGENGAPGSFELQYHIEDLPFQDKGTTTLPIGKRISVAGGKVEFLVEGAPAGAAPPSEPAAEAPEEAPAPRVSGKKKAASTPYYRPRFKDCRDALDACVESGNSFGGCVADAPDCSVKSVKGCCPTACFKAYEKSISLERSEAQAFRENFSAESACGIPPKEDQDD